MKNGYYLLLSIICINFLFSVNSFSVSHLDSGLVLYYPFCGNTLDYSGHGNHGTIVNPGKTQYVKGAVGQGIRLISAGSYMAADGGHILIPDVIPDIPDKFSINLWVSLESFSSKEGESFISFGSGNNPSIISIGCIPGDYWYPEPFHGFEIKPNEYNTFRMLTYTYSNDTIRVILIRNSMVMPLQNHHYSLRIPVAMPLAATGGITEQLHQPVSQAQLTK